MKAFLQMLTTHLALSVSHVVNNLILTTIYEIVFPMLQRALKGYITCPRPQKFDPLSKTQRYPISHRKKIHIPMHDF